MSVEQARPARLHLEVVQLIMMIMVEKASKMIKKVVKGKKKLVMLKIKSTV